MTNILITPAADNRPEELQSGVGSGPYIVTASNRGTGNYTLAKNPKYWAPAPNIDAVQVRFVPDESNRVVSLRSSEVDVIDSISPDSADQLSGLSGVAIDRVDGVRLNQLFYNFRKPAGHPLADKRVRRALTYAIDGNSLIDEVMQGSATASKGVIPMTLTGAIETGEYVYDPARARKELDALGVRDLDLKIIWESGEFVADTDSSSSPAAISPPGVRARPATGTCSATATRGLPAWPSPSCRACTQAPPKRKKPATPTTASSSRRSPRSSRGHRKTPIPPGARCCWPMPSA
jgi:peptide/nickel transport system substrate-binding protein